MARISVCHRCFLETFMCMQTQWHYNIHNHMISRNVPNNFLYIFFKVLFFPWHNSGWVSGSLTNKGKKDHWRDTSYPPWLPSSAFSLSTFWSTKGQFLSLLLLSDITWGQIIQSQLTKPNHLYTYLGEQ